MQEIGKKAQVFQKVQPKIFNNNIDIIIYSVLKSTNLKAKLSYPYILEEQSF